MAPSSVAVSVASQSEADAAEPYELTDRLRDELLVPDISDASPGQQEANVNASLARHADS